MGRPADYSAQEDAIILATGGFQYTETNRQLVEAGFKARTAGAISGRRQYLKANRPNNGVTLQTLLERRVALQQQVEQSQAALEEVEGELADALDQAQAELKGGQ